MNRSQFIVLKRRRLLIVLLAILILVALLQTLPASAATFGINDTRDLPDANPGDGVCSTGDNTCTLRAAIQEANSLPGADTITIPAGVYEIQIPSLNEDLDTTGDFDIRSPMTIVGFGVDVSIIDGGVPLPGADPIVRGMDRLFEIHPGAGNVTIRDVTLREGYSVEDGGAIQNWSSGLLRLENIELLDSYAGGSGGGINNADPVNYQEWVVEPLVPPKSGRIEIVNSTLSGNAAGDSGAAVNNSSMGTVSILDSSQIVMNPGLMIPDPAQVIDPMDPEPIEYIPAPGVYEPSAGAIGNQGADDTIGTVRIIDSTVSGNFGRSEGAGVHNRVSGTLIVENSTFANNISDAGGGALYANGGVTTVDGSTFIGNIAANGAAIYSNGAVDTIGLRPRFTLTNSTLLGNEAHASGGGMYSGGDSQLVITDVTIADNKAHDHGGGLVIADRNGATLTRLTVTGNESHGEGGGAWTASQRLITVLDSHFTDNHAGVPTPADLIDPAGANVAGGGGFYTENGPITISGSTFANNSATEEGGGLSIDNHGDVVISDSVIRDNYAGHDGGGVENSGTRVTFLRLLITGNYAELVGGGIMNTSSGQFLLADSTISLNSAEAGGGLGNAPDNDTIIRGSLFYRNSARFPVMSGDGDINEDGGLGGGILSISDGDALLENTTISGNTAAVGGGGIFQDADGKFEIVNVTVWNNAAPRGGGIGVAESDFVPEIPPKANVSIISRNSIIGGSRYGGSCDWYITSMGGNIDSGGTQEMFSPIGEGGAALPVNTRCFLGAPPTSDISFLSPRDRYSPNFTVDAIADNGGHTLTHALPYGNLAINNAVGACLEGDQRGIGRPQNDRCDAGAYEFTGDPPPFDDVAPETEFGATLMEQDTVATVVVFFHGTDNVTPADDLMFECRLFENDLTEPPEPIAPWDPIPVEFWWVSCSSPWQIPLPEAELGFFQLEVRAVDHAGNQDDTPAIHIFSGDTQPPDTLIVERPQPVTESRSATFSFSGTDNFTPPQFMEFECRLDSRDPDLWLECTNPFLVSDLADGEHTLEVRAYDGAENVDWTPARYTWTVQQGLNCDGANITLTAAADGWVDEVNPTENYLFYTELEVRSAATGDPAIPENARALYRFALPTGAANCPLESATLRLFNDGPTAGRTLEAVPLAAPWLESTLTWMSQPGTLAGAIPATAETFDIEGYMEWDVLAHMNEMLDAGTSHGWVIRDANETDPEGEGQSFISREMPQDPPDITLPQLVLRYEADATPPPPPPPEPVGPPVTVTCGQVITQSITVANDLVGCLGEGLIIGAPNIVLDLDGHKIASGLVLAAGEEDGMLPGIRNGGHSNVVIRNGRVELFGWGVLLGPGTTHNVIEGMTLANNGLSGVYLFDADNGRSGNTVRNNHFDHNHETGVHLSSGAENSVIENNTFIGNGTSIYLFGATGHLIQGNEISGLVFHALGDSDVGISLEGSSDNVLLDNNLSDTGDAGIVIHMASHNNRVEGGEMTRNGDAGVVIADSNGNQVIGILAHQQSDGGVVLSNAHNTVVRDSDLRFNPAGVGASNTNDLLIENNDATHSLQDGFGVGSGLNIRILNNVANLTGGSGISFENADTDVNGNPIGSGVIQGNTTNENLQDGISVAGGGGHLVAGNEAFNNFGYGISADGNIDGGDNRAGGNAEPEQCLGVVCAADNPPPLTPLDLTPPETTITSTPPNPSDSASGIFTFTADDGPGGTPLTAMTFECRIDPMPDPPPEPIEPDLEPPDPPGSPPEGVEPFEGFGWVECSSPFHYPFLPSGPHHFEVRALDYSQNFDLTPDTYDWEIDATVGGELGPESIPPTTRIASAPDSVTTETTAVFHFAGSDNQTPGLNLAFECQLDGQGFSACESPVEYPGLDIDEHTFEVRAIDSHLNVDASPATHTWTIVEPPVDSAPPETMIDSAVDFVTVLNSAIFTFSSSEQGSTFECSIDGGLNFSPCTSPQTYSGLAVGPNEFQVRATDTSNNTDPSPATFAWTISVPPIPTTVYCGMVVMHSILVRNDLHDCEWDGLVVGADGITIDLDGHTIDGKDKAAGVRNDGYDYVTIRNGTVTEFEYGVMLNPNTEHNIVEWMTALFNKEGGITLGQAPHPLDPLQPFPDPPPPTFRAGVKDNIVRNNTLLANSYGVWVIHSTTGTLITNNDITANSKGGVVLHRSDNNRIETNLINVSGDAGVVLVGSSSNTVAANMLEENDGGVYLTLTDSLAGYAPSNNNLIRDNIVVESGGPAIELEGSSNGSLDGNQLIDNVGAFANGPGIRLHYADQSTVRGNQVNGNTYGILVSRSSHNLLEGNFTSNSDGAGIWTADLSMSNRIIGNISNNNTGAGIYVGDETPAGSGTLIEGNETHNNNSYGIHVPKPSHIVKGNFANDNGSWGIYVGDPSNGNANVDGGFNRAMGNLGPLDPITLQPMQCYIIRCDGSGPPPDFITPETLVLQGPPTPSLVDVATFTFSGSDNQGNVTYECRLDGVFDSDFVACTSPHTYSGISAGPHTFEVRAVDIAGNPDPTPSSYTWTVLLAGAPDTTITSGPDLTTVTTEATFTFSASRSASTFECALDGGFVPCGSPITYSGLPAGTHTFEVRAVFSGATDPTPASYSWTVSPAPTPAVVGCGEIIVQSTLVQNDLFDCGGFGLIIGANGITIDLNGHIIDGTGLDAGILNNGYDSVTIMNGVVSEFDFGIQLNPGTSLNVIANMRLETNQETALLLSDADQGGQGNTIRNNEIAGNSHGIWMAGNTQYTVIRNNLVSGNAGPGILLEFSSDNRIEANEIARSGGPGVFMVGGSNNTVIDNVLANNGGFGIAVGEELLPTNNNLIQGNTLSDNQGGIGVASSNGNQILYNIISGTGGPGVVLELSNDNLVRGNDVRGSASGISIEEASNNHIEANNASGTFGSGIELAALSHANQVVQNTASHNGGSGIEVEDFALPGSANVLNGNITDGNGGDGIGVFGAGHTLQDNIARLNGGWGIYAAVGATVLGDNFAAGNAEPGQCFGIVCTIGEVPGAPETWIVSGPVDVDPGTPGVQSNSRNASFTYMGESPSTPITGLIFECRFDTTNDLAWEDCEYPAEYLNLSAGTHVFEIRALDMNLLADHTPARFEWTYVPLPSGVAPEVTIDIVPDDPSSMFEALFTFHANEPDVTFQCRVDLFGYEPCGFEGALHMSQGAYVAAFEETQVGDHTFYVRAVDFEGNVGEPATYTWSIMGVVTTFTDGPGFTPGETPFDPPTGGPVRETTAVLDFIANVADATYECSLDLGPFVPCTPPVTYTGLFQGEHTLRVIATDLETGMTDLELAEFAWEIVDLIDEVAPVVTIELAPPDGSSATTFEFQGTDNLTPPWLLTFECRVDSSNNLDWFECISPFSLLDFYTYQDPQLAPGLHTFEVRATDDAEPADPNSQFEGNISDPVSYTWTMIADVVEPGTAITAGPGPITGSLDLDFAFMGIDNATPALLLTFECSLDGAPYTECASPESVQGLLPGEHTFSVRAIDLAGNVDSTPDTLTWTQVSAPLTTITSGPAGQVIDGNPPATPSTVEAAIFEFSADQPGSTFECSLNGADFLPCISPRAQWVVESGTHEFEVRAINAQGLIEDPPAVYIWEVLLAPDTTPPNTFIVSGPSSPNTSEEATFAFSGSDNRTLPPDLTFECSLDGAPYDSCVSLEPLQNLTHGEHTLLVRAVDAADNFDLSPASFTWFVELPPIVTILSGPGELTESRDATFTFISNVAGSTFVCWLDVAMVDCDTPVTYTDLAPGDHVFAVYAVAPGGTLSLQWEEWEWRITDLTPPITIIESGPDVQSTSNSATFVFSSNRPEATFQCALDGGNLQACTSPVGYPFLWPGAHSFQVVATLPPLFDQFGQPVEPGYEPVPTFYEWTIVDLIPPETLITFGPAATSSSPNAYFGFASNDPIAIIECALDGGAFSECEPVTVYEDLLPGAHTLSARAVDLVGNVDPTPASYAWTIVPGATNNTPAGTNVVVELPVPDSTVIATVTFLEVATAGTTTLDVLSGGPHLPAGYFLAGGSFYDIFSTAEGEVASLCIPYDPDAFPDSAVRLLNFDGSLWMDITNVNDPAGRVCGIPEEFGLFAVAGASGVPPLATVITGPPLVSNSSSATFTFWADVPGSLILCSLDGLPMVPCTSPITFFYLEEGEQEFMLSAIAPDGQVQILPTIYEWEVILGPDTTPPDTTILSGAPLLTVNWIHWFTFEGIDDQTAPLEMEFECSLDGGPFESCETPEEIEVLTAGDHTLDVRAVDLAGNVDPTPAVWSWTIVDASAPETEITLEPEEETPDTFATFEFIGLDVNGNELFDFDCSLDGADFSSCTSPQTYTGLAAGAHVFQVRAKNPAGVVDPTPEFYAWLITGGVDTTPPDTFIVSAPPPGNSGPDVIFGFSASEPVETFECALDGGPWEECEAVHILEGLEQGFHVLLVRSIDLAIPPNIDATPAIHTWETLGEPDTFILSGPPSPSGGLSATFTFTSTQAGATFQCAVDGSPFVPCTSPFIAGPFVEEGDHEFEVRAVNEFTFLDGTQVVDLTPAVYEWVIEDVEPPDTTITSVTFIGPEDLVEPNSWKIEFTGVDNRTASFELEFECAIDGGPWEGCETPHYIPLEDLSGGDHELQVRAVDEMDNPDPTPAVTTLPTEPEPDTFIDSGPVDPTDSTEATFTFSSDQPDVTFECSLDLTEYVACASPVTFTNVAYGEHELLVRAVSLMGTRVDLTPAEYTWASGYLTPIVVTILTGPDLETTDTTATFTFEADVPDALFLCSLDGETPQFCTSPITYTSLLGGVHTFELEATRPNQLVEGEPAIWEWTVLDGTAPETTIVSGPPAEIGLGTSAVFVFLSNEPDASFECSFDAGATFDECAGPPLNIATFDGLAAGEYNLLVRAVDPGGNVDGTPASYTFVVVGPPVTTLLTTPADPTEETSATFTFEADQADVTFACALDGANFLACESPVAYTNLTGGSHLFAVQATNEFGLTETDPVEYSWTVTDLTAPETTIELGPAATTASTSATFVFSANELEVLFECRLDSVEPLDFVDCSNGQLYTGLGVGTHTFEVRAIDAGGNVDATPAAYTWEIVTPPAANTPVGAPVTVVEGDVTVTFASVSVAGLTTVDVLGGMPTLPTGYLQVGALYYDISTSATYLSPVTVCVDYTPGSPAEPVRLLHFESDVWVDITTSSDPDAGLVCGEAGSLSPFAVASGTVAVVPDTFIDEGPPAATASTSADFAFSSDDPFATFECSLDAPGSWGSCSATTTFNGLAVGEHTLLVRAENQAGLFDASPATWTWTVLPMPDTFITAGPDEATGSTTATFEFSSDMPDATFECLLDDAAFWSPCTSPLTYTGLPLGEHTLLVRAEAVDGNVDPTPAEWEWEIGYVPPPVVIESGPDAETNSTTATFVFSSSDPDAQYECALDSAPFAACVSPKPYSGLPLGSHTFQVRVFHSDPIIEPPVTAYEWVVGTSTPAGTDVTVALMTFDSTGSAEVTFATVDVAGASMLAVDENPPSLPGNYLQLGALFYDISTTASFSGLITVCLDYTPGSLPEPVQLLHFDEAGVWTDVTTFNDPDAGQVCGEVTSLSPFAVAALAPPPPPETTIDSAPANPSSSTTATFTFSADKPDSTFQCALDGAPFSACTSPASYTTLAMGAHEFQVRATDPEGQVDPTPAGHIWTIKEPVDCGEPVTFAVSTDAWIDQNSPTNNFGTDSILKVQSKESNNNMRALVSFNLPTSPPAGCVIQAATLRMFAPSAVNGRTLQALRLSSSWTENGVTWSNQPGTTGTAATTSSGQDWREWDVAEQVIAMVDSGQNYGFLIRDASEGGGGFEQQFHAREKNENVPVLIVTYTAGGNGDEDITPPQTTIETGPEIVTMDTSATFTFSADEPTIGYECSLNGASFAECESPVTYDELAVDDHIFAVRAIDLVGLIDPTPATYDWTVEPTPDTTPPQSIIESGPELSTISRNATFTFSADEAGSTFECSLDDAPWAVCASPRERTDLALGSHTYTVRATDQAGNIDPSPASYTWVIVAPPETTVDSGPEATTTATDASFTFSANVPGSTFECALDGAAWAACTSPQAYTGLALGAHTFTVQAIDPDGHTDPTPASYAWTIQEPPDTVAPETTIAEGPESPTLETDAQFAFSANEPATFECALDGAPYAACASPLTYTNLSRGAHSFSVRAIDQAGNVDASPASVDWMIDEPPPGDSTPPETFISSGPESSTVETGATFAFSANEEATFACSLDGAEFAACTTPQTYTGLALGPHNFAVQATDLAGNVDPDPATYSWEVIVPPDTTPPQTQISAGPPASTVDTSASFSFSADESGSTFECLWDVAAWTVCTTPATYSELSEGDHTFAVRAIDPVGNVDPTPATYDWTVLPPPDTTPPQTTITSEPAATTTSTSASFAFMANETGVTFECSLDGAGYVACASPRDYTNLSAGTHTFAVRGTDEAGNIEAPPVSYSWTVSPPPDCGPQIVAAVTADSWVEQGSSSNKGDDGILKVQGKSSNAMRALLKFALPTDIPEGCVVESATLRLYAASWKNNRTLQVYRLNGNWTENGVTWGNQPGTTGSAVTTTSGKGWRQWEVSSMVQTMLDTGVNNGFLVRDASEGGSGSEQQFHSREKGNNIPVLIINLVPAGN